MEPHVEVLVVVNPAAAGVSTEVVRDVEKRLAAVGARATTTWTRGPGDACAQAARCASGVDLVLVLGGDGTAREVAQALLGRPSAPALVALPAGSGCSTARNVWGDLDLAAVLDVALDPAAVRVRALDAMRLVEPGTVSLLGASSGFLADVLVQARAADPALSGLDRYHAGAAVVLGRLPSHPTRVTVDGVVLHDGPASSVTVGGGRYRARTAQFLPRSLLDDGLLDVCVLGPLDGAAVLEVAGLLADGTHLDRPEVSYGRGRSVVLERTDGRPLLVEHDGEVWDGAGDRLTVEVLASAVRVLAPVLPPCG
jgi:diacylglycerol kinase (ATP)